MSDFSEQRLREVMAAVFFCRPEDIHDGLNQDNFPAWDSLRHMNLVLALEEEFELTLPDEEAPHLTSYALLRLALRDLL